MMQQWFISRLTSILCLSFSLSFILSYDLYGFEDQACIDVSFNTMVTHQAFPFGITTNRLSITKKECLISIEENKYKFFDRNWYIDICRTPIHIKKGKGSSEILKRKTECNISTSSENPFCSEFSELLEIIQDSGLIFAVGDRENLTDPHGQVYCINLLLKKYLGKGWIFSRNQKYENVLSADHEGLPTSVERRHTTDLSNGDPIETKSKELPPGQNGSF